MRPHSGFDALATNLRPGRSRFTAFFSLFALVAAFVATHPAAAAWQPDGVPLSPAPPEPHAWYYLLGLRSDGTAGAYVTWQYSGSPAVDVSEYAMVAQRVDLLGNRPPGWGAEGTRILTWYVYPYSSGIYSASPVALVSDGAGGALHALVSQSDLVEPHSNFNLHHLAPNGVVAGIPGFSGDLAGGATLGTAVDGDGAGGVIQIGIGQTFAPPLEPRPPSPLFARRVTAAGATAWQVDNVIPAGLASGGLAALNDGELGGWFAWIDMREPGDRDLYVQRFDDTGAPAPGFAAGGMLVCGAPGDQFDPHLTSSGDGGVFVVWRDERDGTSRIYASHVLPAGGIAPGIPADGVQIPASAGGATFVNLAFDGQNGCFLVGEDGAGIGHLYRLDGALQPHAGWPAVGIALHSQAAGYGAVGLAADDAGGAYVSFRNGFGTTAPQGLYAQHYAGDGTLAPGWGAPGYRLSGSGGASMLVRSGAGAIVAWDDFRTPYPGVYAQRIVTDGPVSAEMSLVSADASAGKVSLHWFASDAAGLALTLERRTETNAWSRIADLAADGTGNVRYEDGTVAASQRYGYRLAWSEGDAARTSAETWVTTPAALALALEAPRPNPSSREVALAITLPAPGPARLEVLDLAGRRIASRDLSALGAGRHVVALREAESLAPGLYVLQLVRAGEARRAKLLRVP